MKSAAVDKQARLRAAAFPGPRIARRRPWYGAAAVRGVDGHRAPRASSFAGRRSAAGIWNAREDFAEASLKPPRARSHRKASRRDSTRRAPAAPVIQVCRAAPVKALEEKSDALTNAESSNCPVPKLRATRTAGVLRICTPKPLVGRQKALVERNRTESQIPSNVMHAAWASFELRCSHATGPEWTPQARCANRWTHVPCCTAVTALFPNRQPIARARSSWAARFVESVRSITA